MTRGGAREGAGRPPLESGERATLVGFRASVALLEAIEDYRERGGWATRSQAIRVLLLAGLLAERAAEGHP